MSKVCPSCGGPMLPHCLDCGYKIESKLEVKDQVPLGIAIGIGIAFLTVSLTVIGFVNIFLAN